MDIIVCVYGYYGYMDILNIFKDGLTPCWCC